MVLEEQEFKYVVERPPPSPICFGSKLLRTTAPIGKGLSPFQKMTAPELRPDIGPGHYPVEKIGGGFQILTKIRSKKGVGPLASDDPRFKDKIFFRTPSPTRYDVSGQWGSEKESMAPFGVNTKRETFKINKLPGPGTYDFTKKKCQRTRFMYNFGQPTMVPTIEIFCVARPKDTCIKCEQLCARGDYWHKNHLVFLCHLCWEEEKRAHELYNKKELKSFQKIRNCSFAHRHENTTAAIRLHPPRSIKKKLRLENYLDLYLKC